MWQCALCEATAAGTAVKRSKKRDLCTWCLDELTRRGEAWCTRGRHKVKAMDMATNRPECRACRAAEARRHPAANAARTARWAAKHRRPYNPEYRRAQYQRHRDKEIAHSRAYRQRNHDRVLQMMRDYRERNREYLLAAKREYRLRRKLQILRGWKRAA